MVPVGAWMFYFCHFSISYKLFVNQFGMVGIEMVISDQVVRRERKIVRVVVYSDEYVLYWEAPSILQKTFSLVDPQRITCYLLTSCSSHDPGCRASSRVKTIWLFRWNLHAQYRPFRVCEYLVLRDGVCSFLFFQCFVLKGCTIPQGMYFFLGISVERQRIVQPPEWWDTQPNALPCPLYRNLRRTPKLNL